VRPAFRMEADMIASFSRAVHYCARAPRRGRLRDCTRPARGPASSKGVQMRRHSVGSPRQQWARRQARLAQNCQAPSRLATLAPFGRARARRFGAETVDDAFERVDDLVLRTADFFLQAKPVLFVVHVGELRCSWGMLALSSRPTPDLIGGRAGTHTPCAIERLRRIGPRLRGDDRRNSISAKLHRSRGANAPEIRWPRPKKARGTARQGAQPVRLSRVF
jgi:hypothetical protein